jgi:hypothetical protein
MMTDEELIAQAVSLIPVYVDGFGAFRKTNGVFRAVGFVADTGAVLNLIVSLTGADHANHEGRRILDEKPVQTIGVWSGSKLAH